MTSSGMLIISILYVVILIHCIQASIFDYEVIDGEGNSINLSKYQDKKVIIIVNVASRCGFTHVNYRGLRELYDTWGPKGLEILAFPSNEFGNQEPGSNEEIQLFCRDYGLSFPVMAKVDVNGLNSHPLFEYLKLKTGHTQIAWNFEKFLVVNGEPVKRYRSRVPPAGINDDDDTCDDNDTNDDEIDVEN